MLWHPGGTGLLEKLNKAAWSGICHSSSVCTRLSPLALRVQGRMWCVNRLRTQRGCPPSGVTAGTLQGSRRLPEKCLSSPVFTRTLSICLENDGKRMIANRNASPFCRKIYLRGGMKREKIQWQVLSPGGHPQKPSTAFLPRQLNKFKQTPATSWPLM